MKIQIDQKNFLGLISKAQNVVEKRNSMQILVNVLIEAKESKIKIYATDLEVSLTDEMECKVLQEGKAVINAKSLFDIVKELPEGEIAIEKKKNHWVEIQHGKSFFNIVGLNPEEYPVFPTFSTNKFTKLSSSILLDMIEKTIYSVSNDETRYHLNGVYFEKQNKNGKQYLRMVATDGHRLSLVDREIPVDNVESSFNAGVIIPRKGLNELKKLVEQSQGDLEMAIEGAQLVIKSGPTFLFIRLIEGKYPNYQQLIPQNLPQSLEVNRETLLSSLKRVSLLSNQKSKGVTFSLTDGKMEITSNNPEMGDAKEELEINYKGQSIKIGFNARYVLDVLSSFDEDTLSISLNDQLSPGMIKPKNDTDYTCVVMPMRI
ncbi:MAG: DNA polymerase III subunit beta [Bdellovibrionaceae bacterium]|nr:DNA polymerase III subunit beta [Pseudobdellovibrionaceae bacterium]